MLTLALALTIAVAPPAAPTEPPPAAMDEEDRWVLLRAREWMARVGLGDGSGWEGDVAAGLRDAAPLAATDPQIRELEPLLRSVASAAPRGIFADDAPAPASWTFAWLDFDGDGRREIVLAGGTSPAPFFAVLQRTEREGSGSWRVLHQAPFRFLGAGTHAGHLYFFGAFDGYGVGGPALAVDSVDANGAGPASNIRLLFDMRGWEAGRLPTEATIDACTTSRRTKLRTEPRRDDAPREDGLGAYLPGNLFQTIEKGSTGWRLGAAKGPDGRSWALCFFFGPSPMDSEHPEREMLKPRKLDRGPLAAGGRVLVGWVPVGDLVLR